MSKYLQISNIRSIGFLLFLCFGYINPIHAQEDDGMSLMEAAFMQDMQSGALNQLGQACQMHMDNKAWQPVQKNKKGEQEYYIIGVGSVSASMESPAFADSLQNGSIKALLNAKTNFAKILSQDVTSDIISEVMSQYSEGKTPDLLQTENIDSMDRSYKDLTSYEKTKLLIAQQLDKLIDPETKQQFNEANKSGKEAAKAPGAATAALDELQKNIDEQLK